MPVEQADGLYNKTLDEILFHQEFLFYIQELTAVVASSNLRELNSFLSIKPLMAVEIKSDSGNA